MPGEQMEQIQQLIGSANETSISQQTYKHVNENQLINNLHNYPRLPSDATTCAPNSPNFNRLVDGISALDDIIFENSDDENDAKYDNNYCDSTYAKYQRSNSPGTSGYETQSRPISKEMYDALEDHAQSSNETPSMVRESYLAFCARTQDEELQFYKNDPIYNSRNR